MSTIDRALVDGRLRGRLTDDGWVLQSGDDEVGRLRGDRMEVADLVLRVEEQRGQIFVRDDRGSVVGILRRLPYRTVVVRLGAQALRVAKQRGLPATWTVTFDMASDQILKVTRLGRSLRFRAGTAPSEHGLDAPLVAALVALAVAPVDTPATVVTA